MNACVCSSGTNQVDRLLEELGKDSGDFGLYRSSLLLSLPAQEVGSVLLDQQLEITHRSIVLPRPHGTI